MTLSIPAYSQLDTEQVEVLNLPLTGKHLVVGPPGSGKTILAIHRTRLFWKDGLRSVFLTHGKALSRYLDQAILETPGAAGSASTMHAWLYWLYQKYFKRSYPGVGEWVVDWMQVLRDVDGMRNGSDNIFRPYGRFQPYAHMVLDEGQDFAKEMYLVLHVLADSVTVFADENQRLYEDNSTIRDIASYMAVDRRCCQPHVLRKNHRNTLQIALVAREFYAGAASGIPELPDRQGDKPLVVCAEDLSSQARFIARYARTYAHRSVGVICPHRQTVSELERLIRQFVPGVPVQSNDREFDFRKPGVILVTYQTAKGLEFDTVFLPALDRLPYSETDVWKMRLYVAMARARSELVLLYSADAPAFLTRIPSDLLNRYEAREPSGAGLR